MNPFVNKCTWPKDIWKYEYSMATCLHYLASKISGAYFIRFGAFCATSLIGCGVRPTFAERLLSHDALNTRNSLRKLLKIRTFIQRFIKLHQYFSHVPIHGSWLWPNILLGNFWEASFYTWQLWGKLDWVLISDLFGATPTFGKIHLFSKVTVTCGTNFVVLRSFDI